MAFTTLLILLFVLQKKKSELFQKVENKLKQNQL